MGYAEVAVDAPTQPGRTFSYSFSADEDVRLGHAVRVPFGSRQLPGFVFETPDVPAFAETRPIAEVVGPGPLLSLGADRVGAMVERQLPLHALRGGLADDAAGLSRPCHGHLLPQGRAGGIGGAGRGERRAAPVGHAARRPAPRRSGPGRPQRRRVVDLLRGRDPVPIAEIERAVGKKPAAVGAAEADAEGRRRQVMDVAEGRGPAQDGGAAFGCSTPGRRRSRNCGTGRPSRRRCSTRSRRRAAGSRRRKSTRNAVSPRAPLTRW